MNPTFRVSPGSIPGRPPIDEQRTTTKVAAPITQKQSAPTLFSEATGREAPAIFETNQRSSLVESGNPALSRASVDVAVGSMPLLKMLLTRSDSLSGFSPKRAGEIGATFHKAELAGSLDWKGGLPRALLGRFFAAVELPRAQPDGNKYTAYVFVGEQKTDPNDATEVYITRVGARKDHVRVSVASEGVSDANKTPSFTHRSPAEKVWKEIHGEYPDQSTTIMAKTNWSSFKIDFPE